MTTTLKPPPLLARSAAATSAKSPGFWARGWRKLQRDRLAMGSLGVVIILALMALGADLIAEHITGHTYYEQSLLRAFAPPLTPGYILGADELGRDVLTRTVYGARISLAVAGLTVLMALTVGAVIGGVAGYFGGVVDGVLMRLVDIVISLPGLFILILISTFFTPSPFVLAAIIASLNWTGISRLVRGEVLAVRSRDFIDAAHAVGVPNGRILARHILPNIVHVMIVWASLQVGAIILTEAALSFLSFGIQPPTPSWGNMLTNAQQTIYHSISLVLIPGFFIFITVLAVNLLGNGLRDALDPRLKE